MIQFTITPLNGTESFQLKLPTKWADVTLAEFIRLENEPHTPPLAILTELTIEQITCLLEGSIELVIESLNFLADALDLIDLLPTPNLPKVDSSTYGQFVLATQQIEQRLEQSHFTYAPYVYALYRSHQIWNKYDENKVIALQESILAAPVTESYANMVFYINDLAAFYGRHAVDGDENDGYSDEEDEAGIEGISARFGSFATLDALCNGDPTKYEQLLALDAETILTKIRLTQLQNQVQRKIQNIQAAKI